MVQICFLVVLVLFNLTSSSSQENITDSERFSKANATACEEGRYVLNKCEERCECRDGKLMNCYRVRKEFTKMDINSRRRFLRTYKWLLIMLSSDVALKKSSLIIQIPPTNFFTKLHSSSFRGIDGGWSHLKTFSVE